ncbi:MAG: hypothetical protein DWQ30_24870 [Acidobacteria bacterium]|nr:MAG: hypothetical protein DWQ30_24870 [Acidobacteriota bacterium]
MKPPIPPALLAAPSSILWATALLASGGAPLHAAPAIASELALPLDLRLDPTQVALEVHRGEVNLIFDAGSTAPRLYVTDPTNTTRCTAAGVAIDCRPPSDARSRLVVDLVLPPGVAAVVGGLEIDLAVGPRALDSEAAGAEPASPESDEDPPVAGEVEGSEKEPSSLLDRRAAASQSSNSTFGPLELHLVDSRLYWTSSASGIVTASGSSLLLEATTGDLELALVTSHAQIRDHRGKLTATAQGGEIAVDEAAGAVELRGEGARADLRSVRGQVRAEWHEGSLRVEDGGPGLEVAGNATSLTLSRSHFSQGWSASGSDLQLLVSEVSGAGVLELTGGGGELERVGALKLDASATQLALRDADGQVDATLQPGSSLEVQRAGVLSATVREATLIGREVRQLQLDADAASLELSAIGRLGSWKVNDSVLVADFTGLGGAAGLVLDGACDAEVSLATPCFVRLEGRTTPLSSGLRVVGCEIMTPQQNRRMRHGGLQRLDGGRGTVFRVDIDDRSTLTVRGRD